MRKSIDLKHRKLISCYPCDARSFFRFVISLFGFQCAFDLDKALDNRAKLSLKARFQANERRLLRGGSP